MKTMKKVLSLVLAFGLIVNLLGMTALASTTVDTQTTQDGDLTTTTTTTTTTNYDAETGKTTTVVTVETVVTDAEGNVVAASGSVQGKETTVTTEISSSSSTNSDVVIYSKTENSETVISSEDGEPTESTVQDWHEVDKTTTQDWTKDEEKSSEKTEYGEYSEPTETTEKVSVDDPLGTAEDDASVTLELTPGGKDEEKVYIDIRGTDFDPSVIPQEVTDEDYTNPETGVTGKKTVVVEEVVKNGEVVGYNVTTTIVYDEQTISDKVVGETVETGRSEVQTTKTAPEGYEVGTVDDGNGVVTVTKPIYDTDGKTVIGYEITKTTTTTGSNTEESEPVTTITLPENYEVGTTESTDEETGATTTKTVEEIVENGQVVGYKVTTTVSANDKITSSESVSVYGVVTTVGTTVVTDPTKETVTTDTTTQTVEVTKVYGTTYTQDVYLSTDRTTVTEQDTVTNKVYIQLVDENNNPVYYTYSAEMAAVLDNCGVSYNVLSITPNEAIYSHSYGTDDDIQSNTEANNASWSWYYSDEDDLKTALAELKDGEYILVGRAMISEYNIDDNNGGAHVATMYILQNKDGGYYYGYCVELGAGIETVDPENGAYTLDALGDFTTLYGSDSAVAKISSVAGNAFWGTDSGTGSLESVKELLKDNEAYLKSKGYDVDTVVSTLTAGQAMTSTNAAFWTYGAKEGYSMDDIEGLLQYYPGTNTGGSVSYDEESQDYKNIKALYDLLIYLAENDASPAELIDGSDLTGAAITLNSKVYDENGNVISKTVNGVEHETYNADVSFTLEVSTTSINGNLIVEVKQNGVTIATKRLAGENGDGENYETIEPDANGTYTIEGIELLEGVSLSLNLSGTQHLDNVAYVYTCETSQNFVTLASADQKIDLSVNMVFHADEPDACVKQSDPSKTDTTTKVLVETKKETRTDAKETVTTEIDSTTTEYVTKTTTIYGDVTTTTTTETVTTDVREWSDEWEETYMADDNVPQVNAGGYGDPDEEEIFDEELPLAEAPETGDISGLWMAMAALSGSGLIGLGVLTKKRKEDEK